MRSALKFLLTLAIAFVLMLAFRALVLTVCTVEGDGLAPWFVAGDRVVINRWSYGLRTGKTGGLFSYGRLCRQEVRKGDFIAFEDEQGRTLICRCTAVPGDTVRVRERQCLTADTRPLQVPGLSTCADRDYYWVEPVGKNNRLGSEQLGLIPEERIIGRVCLLLFSRDPADVFWKGFRRDRFMKLP